MTISPAGKKQVADPLAEETDVGPRDDSYFGSSGMTIKALRVSGVS
jgi:hypothetical protein